MLNDKPVLSVLWSAIKWMSGLLILLSILALPFGGPLLLLYYRGSVLLYIVPVGLLAGALIGLRNLIYTSSGRKKKQAPRRLSRLSKLVLAVFFTLLIGFTAFPYFTLGQVNYVEVPASWHVVDTADHQSEFSHRCDHQLILLVPETHDKYELVCDQALLDFLTTKNPERIQIRFRVTYNFGEPDAHSLYTAGPVHIEGVASKWVGGWSGCGGIYEHSCDDTRIQDASSLIGSAQVRELR